MKYTDFSLVTPVVGEIKDVPAPKELTLRVRNFIPKVKRGQKVVMGEVLAEAPSRFGGALIAPASGKVSKLTRDFLHLALDGKEEAVEPVALASLEGKDRLRAMQKMGINVAPLHKAETIIVNGLNPEPGIGVAEQLLKDETKAVQAGLELAREIVQPSSVYLYIGRHSAAALDGAEPFPVDPVYPASIPAIAAKAVTGKEYPPEVVVLSVMDLYYMGRASLTGLPATETFITVGKETARVLPGTPISEMLHSMKVNVRPRDKAILGGPFRGRAIYSLNEGVERNAWGLTHIAADALPPVEDAPCIGCGECVLHCTGRIRADLISRYAEFEMFDKAKESGLSACFECGLCAYHCIARRPLLQYIRFAKDQLAKATDEQES